MDPVRKSNQPAQRAKEQHAIKPGELRQVTLCGAAFFLVLCSYYILRPVRDEMGVQYGADKLHWLFTGTLLLTLIAVPAFGWVVRHMPRRVILPCVYAFFIVNLLGFCWAFSIGTITLTGAGVFFVWLSVFNLFAISLFWSVVSDTFTKEQAHRLYGYISAGGTAGALAGPTITALLARQVHTAVLIGLAALLLAGAAVCMAVMRAGSQRKVDGPVAGPVGGTNSGTHTGIHTGNPIQEDKARQDNTKPIGGSLFAGVPLTLKLPNLRGIALLIICYTAVSTTLYIQLVDLVGQTYSGSGERKAFFAQIDLTVNCIALALQMLGTRFFVQRFGLRLSLSAVPVILLACLATLSVWATAISFAAVQVLHRVAEYAVTRPGREMVYTTVDAESRYKAKSFIDTAVYRANDAAVAWLTAFVRGMGLNGILFIGIPAAIAWFFTALRVGGRHDRLDSRHYPKEAANDPA